MQIDSKAEAERAYRHHHHKHDKDFDRTTAGPGDHSDKGILGVGMDGVEVSPEELHSARQNIEGLIAELEDHKTKALELHGPLGDGHGPVAKTMAASFLDRASQESGVQFALQNYIDELRNVQAAIDQTLGTYTMVEAGVADEFNRSNGGQA